GAWVRTGNAGYRFRSPTPGGPVSSIDVKPDMLKITAGGDGFAFTLDEPRQVRIGVRLLVGNQTEWCAEAPAKASGNPSTTARSDLRDKFIGRPKTAAPRFCTAPPA